MSKRLGIVSGLLLAIVLGLLVRRALDTPAPVFEGRTLSRWLDHHVATSAAKPPYNSPGWKKADEALRQIGTNGIPTLLAMLRAKDPPPLVLKLLERARRHPWTRINYRYAMSRHEEAAYAFEVLGKSAVSAVPELIKIYEKRISPSSQGCAAVALRHVGRGAQAALPVLIRDFTHTNGSLRFYAVSAVMDIGGEPAVVIPALMSALKDPSVDVRCNALAGLNRFGSVARPAVPEILKMLNDPGMVGGSSIIPQVETALWRIAPEKVGKPLVVGDATPMASNGVTTAALKLLFQGQRKTLIPPGRSVPAVAPYWHSDPRPFLTLYRGTTAPGAEDQFLGRFEVLGLPESENVNVSTLCIVADDKIFLCARNNGGDQFLQIRRVGGDAPP
jgi:hypothetical protein